MKKILSLLVAILLSVVFVQSSYAEPEQSKGGQVFFRYGFAQLKNSRQGEVFTDTLNTFGAGKNDKKNGYDLGAGLDLALIRKLGPGDIVGQIFVDYARFSRKTVTQTTTTLLQLDGVGTHVNKKISVSELTVVIAPKYRFEGLLDGKLRPWIIPVGLAFLVNSPPSNDTTYLDIGYHAGVGIEYMVMDIMSIGVDYRYTIASGDSGVKATYGTAAAYVGINF